MVNDLKIKTIIIEDVIESQDYLIRLLGQHFPAIEILGCATNIEDGIGLIRREQPELIFMDIELTDGYSFEILDQIPDQSFEVIFVTAFENMIQKALDHYAFSYITKPIDEQKFIAAVNHYTQLKQRLYSQNKHEMFLEFFKEKSSRLLLQVGSEYISVAVSEIIKCEADGNYSYFFLQDGRRLHVSEPLSYFEGLLVPKGFFKAHRSVLINIECIASIYKKETIILSNGDKVHVSTRNKSKLTELISRLS